VDGTLTIGEVVLCSAAVAVVVMVMAMAMAMVVEMVTMLGDTLRST
jgi:hypothetical protein